MPPKEQKDLALVICIQEIKEDGSSLNLGNQLSPDEVWFLHQAFIADSINNALGIPDVDIKLFFSPKDKTRKSVGTILNYLKGKCTGKKRQAFDNGRLEVVELKPGRWGKKMEESFQKCFDSGYKHVLFIGSRTPTLTHDRIFNAFAVLKRQNVVFGPTLEGRYYLIGFADDYHVPLAEFDWKDEDIYYRVVSFIEEKGLSWEETELWYAVEHPDNLEYLVRDINQFRLTGDEETARETEKVLERILNRMA